MDHRRYDRAIRIRWGLGSGRTRRTRLSALHARLDKVHRERGYPARNPGQATREEER